MSDAAHLLSDLAAFLVSLLTLTFATRRSGCARATAGSCLTVSSRRASPEHTYGYARLEVVGALFSVVTLWLVTGILLTEAFTRIVHPSDVQGACAV